ncbi:unnamed protein product [Polarella glacialis]|uniref:Fungal lipase-type domain-containing protein n=1 Tax=Polarella glacialis TaxID=89957 RepID=A0A813FWW3_POLGL|nr:unnamed protein product [Polarella glacialis]
MGWGPSGSMGKRLTALDLHVFASAMYEGIEKDVMRIIRNATEGTQLAGGIETEFLANFSQIGRWGLFKVPSAKSRVLAIRGTTTSKDAMANTDLFASIQILQLVSRITPVLEVIPVQWLQHVNRMINLHPWMGDGEVYVKLLAFAADAKQRCIKDVYDLIITGHSLGGGLAQIVGARVHASAVTWSPVGVLYNMDRFNMTERGVYRNIVDVQPDLDVVPLIDKQPGFTKRIACTATTLQCHSVRRSGCELYWICGDARGRNMDANCKAEVGAGWFPQD